MSSAGINTLIETDPADAGVPGLSYPERRGLEADAADLARHIAALDTEIACTSGAFRVWCLEERAYLLGQLAAIRAWLAAA